MCPDAREIMAGICTAFIEEWDFDGAKYDLFNCVPNVRCTSTDHVHDAGSMIEGLELTLKLIWERTRALKKDYIVELKQNYATPFLSRYGTMTRAGDTPYNTEGNFLRTLYVQAYSPFAINDYQTITDEDSPEDAACIVLKMMAAGIPTYSIDFDRICQENKAVIAHYNAWYSEHIERFMQYRVPLDGENNLLRLAGTADDIYFLVNDGGSLTIRRSATVLNATHRTDLFVRGAIPGTGTVTALDCRGRQSSCKVAHFEHWVHLDMLPGGMLRIDFSEELH